MILRYLASLLPALCLLAPTVARAENETSATTSDVRPSAFQLELGPQIGVTTATPEHVGAGLGAALLFGVGPRWSVGARGAFLFSSYGRVVSDAGVNAFDSPRSNATGLAHLDGEGRYHPFLTRVVDTWIAFDLGVGAALGSRGSGPGPHLGTGAGIDLHPHPVVSFGVAARGDAFLLSMDSAGSYVYPTATIGVALSFHLPSSSPAPDQKVARR